MQSEIQTANIHKVEILRFAQNDIASILELKTYYRSGRNCYSKGLAVLLESSECLWSNCRLLAEVIV